MSVVNNLHLDTIAVANMATGGVILATAAASVDIASSFIITQTTAGQTMTLANPTSTVAGKVAYVSSAPGSTVTFSLYGATMSANETVCIIWTGTTWTVDDGGRNTGAVVVLATMVVGNNTITHNLALPAGQFSSLIYTALDAVGNDIVPGIRVRASDTTNAMVISSPVARATATTFYISPLV
jgi:hypothetical protein